MFDKNIPMKKPEEINNVHKLIYENKKTIETVDMSVAVINEILVSDPTEGNETKIYFDLQIDKDKFAEQALSKLDNDIVLSIPFACDKNSRLNKYSCHICLKDKDRLEGKKENLTLFILPNKENTEQYVEQEYRENMEVPVQGVVCTVSVLRLFYNEAPLSFKYHYDCLLDNHPVLSIISCLDIPEGVPFPKFEFQIGGFVRSTMECQFGREAIFVMGTAVEYIHKYGFKTISAGMNALGHIPNSIKIGSGLLTLLKMAGASATTEASGATATTESSTATEITIENGEQLALIGTNETHPMSGTYRLTNDINAGALTAPIGEANGVAFTGKFLADGYVIRNITVPLFAEVDGGIVDQLHIRDSTQLLRTRGFRQRYNIPHGIITNLLTSGHLNGCSVSGITVISSDETASVNINRVDIGALVAKSMAGQLTNCTVTDIRYEINSLRFLVTPSFLYTSFFVATIQGPTVIKDCTITDSKYMANLGKTDKTLVLHIYGAVSASIGFTKQNVTITNTHVINSGMGTVNGEFRLHAIDDKSGGFIGSVQHSSIDIKY